MACHLPVEKNVKAAADCKCFGAVMRTYKGMSADEPSHVAEEAAIRVYRFHHPEDSQRDASLTVQRWLAAEEHVH